MSAFVSFRCNFRPFGAASEGTSRAGSEVFRQSFVVAQGRGPHLKDRLGPIVSSGDTIVSSGDTIPNSETLSMVSLRQVRNREKIN